MIRTRDFLLYLVILMFVLTGLAYTGVSNIRDVAAVVFPVLQERPEVQPSAFAPEEVDTRSERLATLRAKLAEGEGEIAAAPPVFTSVDQIATATENTASEETFAGERSVQWCSGSARNPIEAMWPSITEVREAEGVRSFYSTDTTEVTVGTSTETVTETVVAFELPVRSIRTSFDSCVSDTLIGITPAGSPLLNTAAASYQDATGLVGYTRDGFSVYGPVPDPTVLDMCGGQYVDGVYQYHIRANEPFILGCFAGIPAALTYRS